MRSGHEEAHTAKRTPIISWVMVGVLLVMLAVLALGSRRREANMKALCAEYYAAARTAADTARVDGRIVAMVSRQPTTCRGYRVP